MNGGRVVPRIAAWNTYTDIAANLRKLKMTNFRRQTRRERREEVILMIIALTVPLVAVPAMLGI
jgi:hypothetical protein